MPSDHVEYVEYAADAKLPGSTDGSEKSSVSATSHLTFPNFLTKPKGKTITFSK